MNEKLLVFFEVRYIGSCNKYWSGYVLYASGKQVSFELDQIGRDWEEWGYIDQPTLTKTGVMLWEGVCRNANTIHPEWEPDFEGTWRRPTSSELQQMLMPENESDG